MQRPGMILCMALILIWFALQSRPLPDNQQGPPAFFVEEKKGVRVAIGNGAAPPLVRQFADGTLPLTAIALALGGDHFQVENAGDLDEVLRDGEALDLWVTGSQAIKMRRYWMPARWRMALNIPLHPDRMEMLDWQALPGIGEKLAATIEEDRQRNGDFLEFHRLQRVRGIGPKRLHDWEKYFQAP